MRCNREKLHVPARRCGRPGCTAVAHPSPAHFRLHGTSGLTGRGGPPGGGWIAALAPSCGAVVTTSWSLPPTSWPGLLSCYKHKPYATYLVLMSILLASTAARLTSSRGTPRPRCELPQLSNKQHDSCSISVRLGPLREAVARRLQYTC